MSQDCQPPDRATPLDYLRLFRLPNVFTAVADVTMGYLFVRQELAPEAVFACLVAASALLYTAGMVLNDVYDAELDAVQRPDRPIPSGRISLRRARFLGFGLLLVGVAAGWLAGYVQPVEQALAWRGGVVATALAACILLYDALWKGTWLGPLFMGACRALNVLLGMSIAAAYDEGWNWLGYGVQHFVVAGGIGVYVAGITLFARTEAETSRRWQLFLALLTMIAGIGLLGLLHRALPADFHRGLESEWAWLLLVGLLVLTVVRRCGLAIVEPTAEQVQLAVKHGLQSLIWLDAAVTVEVSSLYYAVGILLLLIPSVILGRWVYST